LGGGPVAGALDAAEEAALAVDEVCGWRAPDSVESAGDVTGGVDEDGGDVAAVFRGFPDGISAFLKAHEQHLEPLALVLLVQPVDGR
jgi:hypothetical protein